MVTFLCLKRKYFVPVIKQVVSSSDIEITAHLAHKIWNLHYVPIIGQEQVDYMLDKFQNAEAMKQQIENGYEYFIIYHQTYPSGYLALLPDMSKKNLMISKIYVDSGFRGLNLGTQLLDFSIENAKTKGLNMIWLTVNKNNTKSIEWYQKKGFLIKENLRIDIGNGFIMDDYRMELTIP